MTVILFFGSTIPLTIFSVEYVSCYCGCTYFLIKKQKLEMSFYSCFYKHIYS